MQKLLAQLDRALKSKDAQRAAALGEVKSELLSLLTTDPKKKKHYEDALKLLEAGKLKEARALLAGSHWKMITLIIVVILLVAFVALKLLKVF